MRLFSPQPTYSPGQRIKLKQTWAGAKYYKKHSGRIAEIAVGVVFILLDDGRELAVLVNASSKVFDVITGDLNADR